MKNGQYGNIYMVHCTYVAVHVYNLQGASKSETILNINTFEIRIDKSYQLSFALAMIVGRK